VKQLSIITVNLNNAPGLRKTIESIANQTSRDFEHIIIDGGSTDGSVDVIRAFTDIPQGVYVSQDQIEVKVKVKKPVKVEGKVEGELNSDHFPISLPRSLALSLPHSLAPSLSRSITYWISEPDKGIYHAMNKGIKVAKGDYCQFLNSGDTLVSSDVTERMLQNVNDCSILIGNMLKRMPHGKVYKDKSKAFQKPTFLTFYRGTLNHSPAYIKRNLFDKYGLYDEALRIVSDWKWYLIVIGLSNEPVVYTDIDVSLFDMSGISNSNHEAEKKERKKVLMELVPANILVDYETNWRLIEQAKRINRYKLSRWVFWLVERSLFKWQKIKQQRNTQRIK
jgi:glycosyltransferase involved in cell wall biosynthesis